METVGVAEGAGRAAEEKCKSGITQGHTHAETWELVERDRAKLNASDLNKRKKANMIGGFVLEKRRPQIKKRTNF